MCWQVAASVGLQIAGAGFSVYGQQQAAKGEQKVLERQAKLKNWAASDAIARGERKTEFVRDRIRQVISGQEADFAGRGIDIDSGVVGEFATEAEFFGQMEVDSILDNAEREAFGLNAEAENLRFQGDTARRAANYNSAATVLGVAGDATRSWLTARRFQGGQYGSGSPSGTTAARKLNFGKGNSVASPFAAVKIGGP